MLQPLARRKLGGRERRAHRGLFAAFADRADLDDVDDGGRARIDVVAREPAVIRVLQRRANRGLVVAKGLQRSLYFRSRSSVQATHVAFGDGLRGFRAFLAEVGDAEVRQDVRLEIVREAGDLHLDGTFSERCGAPEIANREAAEAP